MNTDLTDGWTVTAVRGPVPDHVRDRVVPAVVPGAVHLDLQRAGLIPDPYLDLNEQAVAWIGRTDWRYTTTFEHSPSAGHRSELVFAGLDTVATVRLNGEVILTSVNMHRSYRVDVTTTLREGRNELDVTFTAGLDAAEAAEREIGHRPYVSAYPFNAVRKMASNYGWDWGPALITVGVWQPVTLTTWRTARLAAVRPLVDVDGTTGVLTAHVDVTRDGSSAALTARVTVAGRSVTVPVDGDTARVRVEVPDVRRWWPIGHGSPELYDVEVELLADGTAVDAWSERVGFRTVELVTAADVDPVTGVDGTSFVLHVNGMPVFCRGFNWIPDDCFPSRLDRDSYTASLTDAVEANANMVRVWGGGIYERDEFYDVCDELGLLVWQDFLFACAAYAEEQPLYDEVAAEAREAVTRLSCHPSLVLWNGCNENLWGHEDWGWKDELGEHTWGLGYYTDLLPRIVAELDPTRPYTPGSPFSPGLDRHPDDPAHGTMHIWDVWNQRDYTAYRDYRPRFVAEFGFQGPPAWSTLTRAVHDEPLTPTSPGLLSHQKAEDGQGKLARGLAAHLPEPRSIEDWHFATSVNQARAVAYGVEHFRSLWPYCTGTLVWQLNDCWPVVSWAAVDGDGRRKPLWYALRRSFADRLLTVQPRAGGLALIAVNDSAEAWAGDVVVARSGFDGTVLAEEKYPLDVVARSSAEIVLPSALMQPVNATAELLTARAGEVSARHLFTEDVDAALPEPVVEATATAVEGGYRVEVTARTLVRELCLVADHVVPDATVDDMLITLLPGETAVFTVRTAAAVDPAAFTDPSVLRSIGQLSHQPTTSDA